MSTTSFKFLDIYKEYPAGISVDERFYKFLDIPIRGATKSAYHEMERLGFRIADVVAVLEEGYDCGMKRKKTIVERCMRRNGKIIKVVIEKITSWSGIPYWRIRHVGLLTKR